MAATELEQPLVSCIIPAYNAADTIVRAIESARRQTYPNVEIVVVNDGSTDNTEEVVLSRFPEIRYIRHVHNRGPSAARNSGARAARGAVLAFLDADDEWLPVKTEIQLDALARLPNVGVLFTGMLILMDRWEKKLSPPRPRVGLSHFTARDMLRRPLGVSAMVYASTFWALGGFEHTGPLPEAELWARMASRGLDVARLDLPLYVQHVRPGSLSRDVFWSFDAVMHMLDIWAPDTPRGRSIAMSAREYGRLREEWFTRLTLRLVRGGHFERVRKRLSHEPAAGGWRRHAKALMFLVAHCPSVVRAVLRVGWLPRRLLRSLPGRAAYCRYGRVFQTCARDANRFQQAFPRGRGGAVRQPGGGA